MTQLKQGLFITFEGGEGAGKTTLIESIQKELQSEGLDVVRTREPGGTDLGEEIRSLLLRGTQKKAVSPYAELCLFLASRAQHILEVIRPALTARKVVLCDRFNDSSVAYQGVARGLGKESVEQVCAFVSEGLEPHLTLYLDIDPEIGLARAKQERTQDRIEAEGTAFHRKIRNGYLSIHRDHPKRFHRLNASLSPADVYKEAMHSIRPLLLAFLGAGVEKSE